MAMARSGDVGAHLRRLFGAGSAVGLTDSELLERFAAVNRRRCSAAADVAESAFEIILARERFRHDWAAASADGRFLATGGMPNMPGAITPHDPWVRIWDLDTGQEIQKLPTHENSSSKVTFSPDGRLLASYRPDQPGNRDVFAPQNQDPTIRIWDIATGRELRRLARHRGSVSAVVFTPDGRSLISGGDDATALVWDVSDLRQ
jgi:WD40 repeat protein